MKIGKIWIVKDNGQAIRAGSILQSNLKVKHFRNGKLLEERDLGSGMITTAGVNLWAADWTNAVATLKNANWHDSGTGITAPTIGDTVMQTPTGNVRVGGGQTNTINVYQTIGILSYGAVYSLTEWGLWTDVSAGVLFDHRTFAPIPIVSGDTAQFQYQLTIVQGG